MRPCHLRPAALCLAGLLSIVAMGEAAGRTLPTVALDLSRLDDDTYAALDGLALERQVVVRLVQEGFAVVSPAERPYVRLTVQKEGTDLVLEATSSEGTSRARLPLDDTPLPERHLELAQRAAVLAHATRPRPAGEGEADEAAADRGEPDEREADEGETDEGEANYGEADEGEARAAADEAETGEGGPDAGPEPEAAPVSHEATAPAQPGRGDEARGPAGVELGAGGIVRPGGIDPMAHLGVSQRLGAPLVVRVRAGFVHAPSEAIRALEVHLVAGGGLVHPATRSLEIEGNLLAGLLVHRYARVEGGEEGRGLRFDPLLSVDVGATWRLGSRLAFFARLSPGATLRSREHRRDGEILWSRGRFRLEGAAGIAADW